MIESVFVTHVVIPAKAGIYYQSQHPTTSQPQSSQVASALAGKVFAKHPILLITI